MCPFTHLPISCHTQLIQITIDTCNGTVTFERTTTLQRKVDRTSKVTSFLSICQRKEFHMQRLFHFKEVKQCSEVKHIFGKLTNAPVGVLVGLRH